MKIEGFKQQLAKEMKSVKKNARSNAIIRVKGSNSF